MWNRYFILQSYAAHAGGVLAEFNSDLVITTERSKGDFQKLCLV